MNCGEVLYYFYLTLIHQLHILPEKLKHCSLEDLEFFFNKEQGVIDVDGKPKKNPKVR